ncbi:protein SMG7-like isoform X1 [Phoenix dactylifera]|uniref:Protein SMG7-like isoform X1 n=1 Tax=Phoenix dactylifera TaxID=42345 RepID=A0A8B7CA92_PHODC|nr:protein SMG7-like isoform X1 [Phoenix dactylifera]
MRWMMTVPMNNSSAPSSRERVLSLYNKNIELENGLRKSAKSKVPSDPNAWLQMRENYEAIILEDHEFSEKHEIEYALWQLHYRRIEEFRAHINTAASSGGATTLQVGKSPAQPDRIKKIRAIFKGFLSEATGFYHDLILKIRTKYGLPLDYFSDAPESQITVAKDEKKSFEMKKGLISCHRCLIYLGDLARYKGLYGEGDSVGRDYAVASGYYGQAASLWPSSGNPHHQLAILASYSGDDLLSLYQYFRSLAVNSPFLTARDNLIIAFEKNRQNCSQLPGSSRVSSARALPNRGTGKGRGRGDFRPSAKETKVETTRIKERELSTPDIFKAFSTRFIRLNGILFTRTSLETFGEVFALVIGDLLELLSSGPEEKLSFGQDAAGNGLVIVRLIAILIFSVHNAKRESEGQSYAEILQRTVLLENAFTAAFDFVGHILKRCTQLHNAASSYLLPAILVFMEWLACHSDIAAGTDIEEKQAAARSFFWNQFVLLMNKLMLSGFADEDEDKTCFFDMVWYDDGESGNMLALWEDFELRGFSPLAPAQLILDFSSNYLLENDGSNKEKSARVKRILAAGRALMNVVRIGQQEIYYDSKLKKFVIGTKPPAYEDLDASELDDFKVEGPVGNSGTMQSTTANLQAKQSWGQLYVDGEEEDEVIVFKPMAAEKYTNMSMPEAAAFGNIQPAQSSSLGDQSTYGGLQYSAAFSNTAAFSNIQMPAALNGISQPPVTVCSVSQPPAQHITPNTSKWSTEQESFIMGRLKILSIAENDICANPGLLNGRSSLQPTAFSPSLSASSNLYTTSSSLLSAHINAGKAVIPAEVDSIMPLEADSDGVDMKVAASLSAQRKNPVSRPARHFGPPPGFSKNPAKQMEDSNFKFTIKEEQPQMDDYSWLDGYKTSSISGMGMENSINRSTHIYPQVTASNSNSITGAISFPFPGKQISTVQPEMAYEKKWQDFQLFEHLKLHAEKQLPQASQQSALLPEQHQAQSLWSSHFFV